jgi:prevent-host-death family protein
VAAYNIHEAKTHFSKLIERVLAGEEVIIARAGKAVAKIVPYSRLSAPRTPGGWEGRVRIDEAFEELPPELTAAFRGEHD